MSVFNTGVNTSMMQTICAINPALCRDTPTPSLPQTNIKITTPQMQSGQTTLDKILGTFLSFVALQKQAGYVPTTTQPQPQYQTYPADYYANQQAIGGGTGATFGASIENFVTNNTGIIAVGVIGYVLLMSGRKK